MVSTCLAAGTQLVRSFFVLDVSGVIKTDSIVSVVG